MKRLLVVALVVVSALTGVPSHAAVQSESAPPLAGAAGFSTPVVVAVKSQGLVFVNLDPTSGHNIESVALGPDSSPWCSHYLTGHCPLFATPVIQKGETATADLSHLVAGQSYAFICVLHANVMKGTLTVLA